MVMQRPPKQTYLTKRIGEILGGFRCDPFRLFGFTTWVLFAFVANAESPWYIGNVFSTSDSTPGFAVAVPIDETIAVRGTILNSDGTPAAGAEVWGASLYVSPPHRERVFTDADGRFTLHLKPLLGKSHRWVINAFKGSASVRIPGEMEWIDQPNPTQKQPIVGVLTKHSRLRLNIMSSDQNLAIDGATVFLSDGRVMIAGRDGKITIGGLEHKIHSMVVVAAGYQRQRVLVDTTSQTARELNVTLDPGGQFVGMVIDKSGQGIDRAWVKPAAGGSALALDGLCAITDAAGRFVFDGVRPNQIVRALRAGADGFETTQQDRLRVRLGEPESINFRLEPSADHADAKKQVADNSMTEPAGATGIDSDRSESPSRASKNAAGMVSGTVINESGRPVQGVQVRPVVNSSDPQRRNPEWISNHLTQTDQQGRFQINALPDQGIAVDFLHPQYSARRGVDLSPGGNDHQITLESRGAFYGRVIDPDGRPVNDFRVTIEFPRSSLRGDRLKGFPSKLRSIGISYTEKQGRFLWGDEVFPGAVYRVTAYAKGLSSASIDRVVAGKLDEIDESFEQVFRLQEPAELRVKVINAIDDVPVDDASVTLIDGLQSLDRNRFSWDTSLIGFDAIPTDAKGIARCGPLSVREATVVVQAPGYASMRFGWRQSEPGFEVRMIPEVKVTGTIRTTDGQPQNELVVSMGRANETYWDSISEQDDGRFSLTGIKPGDYQFRILKGAQGLFTTDVSVVAGQSFEIDLTLHPETRRPIDAQIKRSEKRIGSSIKPSVQPSAAIEQ